VKNKNRVNCFQKRDKSNKPQPKRSSSATRLAEDGGGEAKRFEIKILSPDARKTSKAAPQTVRKPVPPKKSAINALVRSTAKKSGPSIGSGLHISKSAMQIKKGLEKHEKHNPDLAKLRSPKTTSSQPPLKSAKPKRKSIPPPAAKPTEVVTLILDSEDEPAEEEPSLLKKTEARLKSL